MHGNELIFWRHRWLKKGLLVLCSDWRDFISIWFSKWWQGKSWRVHRLSYIKRDFVVLRRTRRFCTACDSSISYHTSLETSSAYEISSLLPSTDTTISRQCRVVEAISKQMLGKAFRSFLGVQSPKLLLLCPAQPTSVRNWHRAKVFGLNFTIDETMTHYQIYCHEYKGAPGFLLQSWQRDRLPKKEIIEAKLTRRCRHSSWLI